MPRLLKVFAAALGFGLAGLVYLGGEAVLAQYGVHASAGGIQYTLTSSRPCAVIVAQDDGVAVAGGGPGATTVLPPGGANFTNTYGTGNPVDYILVQNTGGAPMACEQDEIVAANVGVHLLNPGDSLPVYRSRYPGQTAVPEQIGCVSTTAAATTLSYYFCRF